MSTEPESSVSATRQVGEAEIVQRPVDHPDAVLLLGSFYDEQLGRYGFAESVDLDGAEYGPPNGIFVVVYQHGLPVGCGGYRWYRSQRGTVEIKKTYLRAELRGSGIGRALLIWLERHAAAAGAEQVILETGVRNTAALRLFSGAGYRPVPSYVSGRLPEINRAFTKVLEQHRASTNR